MSVLAAVAGIIGGASAIGGKIIEAVQRKRDREKRLEELERGEKLQREMLEKGSKDAKEEAEWQHRHKDRNFIFEKDKYLDELSAYRQKMRKQRAESIASSLNGSIAQNDNMKNSVLSRFKS